MLTAEPSSVRVVGIGASAGGLPALKAILGTLPGDFPAALLVVLHLHPTIPSRLAWILGRQAALPVRTAASGDAIVPSTIYVAVPNLHLMVEDRHIRLVPSAAVHHVRPSIDLLFASVARSYGADGRHAGAPHPGPNEASQAIHQIHAGLPATGVVDVPFTAGPGRERPSVPRLVALKDAQDQLVGVVGRVLTDDWSPRP